MKVAFTSCCKLQQIDPQPIWQEIQDERPDVLLLLGDNVYLDHDHHLDPAALADELKRLYDAQLGESNFSALLADMKARGKAVLATYDDHDFLGNDRTGGNVSVELRNAARDGFVAAFNPRRTGADVYSSQRHGDVRVIVLDTRYYRNPVVSSLQDRDAMLGVAQWQWLEAELARKDTRYLLLASSSTFHRWDTEAWENYPAAFSRLRDAMRGRSGALVVSGDIHSNELYDESGVLEVVSSGVARRGILFGGLRSNYGLLAFDDSGMDIALRSNRAGNRFQTRVTLDRWQFS